MWNVTGLRSRGSILRLSFILLMALWPLLIQNDYAISVMVMAGLYATLTLGIGLLLGQAGQISFGHGAFFGVGAYTGALLSTKLSVPPPLAIAAGAVIAGLIAYVVGRPVLRLRFYFLALATIGLGVIFVVIVREARWLTGGTWGVTGIPWLGIGAFEADDYLKQYYTVWTVVIALWLFTERALRSRVGRALRALAVSEVAASTLGIFTAQWKLRTFVVSAIYAGIGGGLYAFTLTAINPNDFTISLAIIVVIMVMVGGMDSLFGAIVGAILMTWVGQAFSSYQEYSGGLYALVLILLLIFLPSGIAGGLPIQARRFRRLLEFKPGKLLADLQGRFSQREASTERNQEPPRKSISGYLLEREDPSFVADTKTQTTASSNGELLLRLEGVSVDFGGLQALDEVSIDVPEGTTAALIGPNGAGKTTLFNVVSGLQRPSAGRVWFEGQEITLKSAAEIARSGMARTFQNLRVFGNMTVLENVMVGRHRHESTHFLAAGLGLAYQLREEKKSREQSLRALALVRLESRADWPVTSLSYGEQRLVEIARALATEPRLLLLDEPAAGMNVLERKELMEKIAGIREAGVTVLLVGHDMELVMGISDRVSVLDYGRLIAEGKPEEVQVHPAVIEAYLGARHRVQREIPVESGDRSMMERSGLHRREEKETLLHVEGVSTYYGSIGAVRDVTLRVNPGATLAVLGPNGAGKTTLLRTISGILKPLTGRVIYKSRNITRLTPPEIARAGIGHVPEGRHVFPTLSVYDNLLMGACHRRDRNEISKSAEFTYELFAVLKERHRQLAGTLSGGEQQMLAIGRALMGNPQLLLLDEPSMGLAPLVVEHIFEALATLNRRGLTLLMVEQNAEMALSIADHAVVLQTGSVALSGPAAELQKDERVRKLYLGSKQPVDSVIH